SRSAAQGLRHPGGRPAARPRHRGARLSGCPVMPIHPWDAPHDADEWQQWLAGHDFGQLAVNGPPGEPPWVQPLHFAYDAGRGEAVTHLARPNPLWPAVEANPEVVLSVVDDYVYVPGP